MKNFKAHIILSLFILFVLYQSQSQTDFELSFLGSTVALVVTAIFFLKLQSELILFIQFHCLSLVILCIAPSLLTFLTTLFCIFFRELVLRLEYTKQENTKESLFCILSISQPIRNTRSNFFLAFIIALPTWLYLWLCRLVVVWDLKYLPFILFSLCFSQQLLSDFHPNWCQDNKRT
ncbi:MAG: hypothetical protein V4591_06790 [Bdellovibrionota bacterium]